MPAKKTSRKGKKQVVKKEEPLFVGLSESDNIQRHVLQCSKESLLVLKKLEEIKKLRKQKMESITVLASLMNEIKSLNLKLKKKIPAKVARQVLATQKEDLEAKEQAMVKPKKPEPKSKKVTKLRKEMTELEKLEAELAAIENRLQKV